MRKGIVVAILAMAVLTLLVSVGSAKTEHVIGSKKGDGCGQHFKPADIRPVARSAWKARHDPGPKKIATYHHQLKCAAHGRRGHIRKEWKRIKHFFQHLHKITPFYGCTVFGHCRHWPIPANYVECESGGDFTPDVGEYREGGAFGLIGNTWAEFGGLRFAEYPSLATPYEQIVVAAKVWAARHDSAWAPFEGGCS